MTKVHVVSHTHWDREWYKSFQTFRVKLVYVIDKVLQILETDDSFHYFLLDGQTVVLDDYLQVKPEKRAALEKWIGSGRLRVGPWYIQPDEFVPDGESLVRNLMIGITTAESFGESMMVGYLPDSFGQTGQLPHILRGFDIESAVVMRGVAANTIQSSEFVWQGTNGETVLGIYLPDGYTNAMHWPKSFQGAKLRFFLQIQKLKKWASTKNILLMNGVDHQFPQAHVADHIERLSKKWTPFEQTTIESYIDAVLKENPDLPCLEGDLVSPDRNRVHTSIVSTRIYQKLENSRMQTLLEKYVEPAAVMGWLHQAEYPAALINQTWKRLLQNQTHDGLGGCCTDEVHREMDQRYVDVKNTGETLLKSFTRAIACRVSPEKLSLVVFNNAFIRGRQSVQATVYVSERDFILQDAAGSSIPYQLETIEAVDVAELSIWTLYLDTEQKAYKATIRFDVDFDFNVGYRVYRILEKKMPSEIKSELRAGADWIENQFCRLEIQPNGSLTLYDKESNQVYKGLHSFEDVGDAGDTYNYSPVLNDTVITSEAAEAEIVVREPGPLACHAEIKLNLSIPLRLDDGDQARSAERVDLPLTTRITVHANHNRIDFVTEVDNTAFDHRLRVCFPVGFAVEHAFVQTQFGTVKRSIQVDTSRWESEKWSEKPLPIYAMQRFVALNNGQSGLAVLNRGLPEYEVYPGSSPVMAITLLRGVGMMGKENLLIRPGRPSGMLMPTPDAQCSGKHVLEYALYPHSGDIDQGQVAQQAAVFDAPVQAVQSFINLDQIFKKHKLFLGFIDYENLASHIRDQMDSVSQGDCSLVQVSNEVLCINAVKKAEFEDALIIRLYNSSSRIVRDATITLSFDSKSGSSTNFLEHETGELSRISSNGFVLPEIPPYSAATYKFNLG